MQAGLGIVWKNEKNDSDSDSDSLFFPHFRFQFRFQDLNAGLQCRCDKMWSFSPVSDSEAQKKILSHRDSALMCPIFTQIRNIFHDLYSNFVHWTLYVKQKKDLNQPAMFFSYFLKLYFTFFIFYRLNEPQKSRTISHSLNFLHFFSLREVIDDCENQKKRSIKNNYERIHHGIVAVIPEKKLNGVKNDDENSKNLREKRKKEATSWCNKD